MRKAKKAKVFVEGLYCKDPRSFNGIGDVRQYVGRTSRSVSEAFKDADYAQAIWRCETEFQQGWRFLVGIAQGMLIITFAVAFPVLLVVWVLR